MHLGGRCVVCVYGTDIRGLVLDHKFGDGREDRARLGAKISRYYVKHLEEATARLQVLCATCNQIKACEEKEHGRSKRISYELPMMLKQ